jgi:hypothetical protein
MVLYRCERGSLPYNGCDNGRNGLERCHGIHVLCEYCLLSDLEVRRNKLSGTLDGVVGLLHGSGHIECTTIQEQNRCLEEIPSE